MFMRSVLHVAKYAFSIGILALFVASAPAVASPSSTDTFTVSGTVACGTSVDCSAAVGTSASGTFSINSSNDDVVGSWSFSTPYGDISSSGAGAFSENATTGPFPFPFAAGQEGWVFCGNLDGSECSLGVLIVLSGDSLVLLSDTPGANSSLCQSVDLSSLHGGCMGEMDFTSGTVGESVAGSSTPEPSSLLLLGIGLLGLGPFIRRFAHS
jgi:hypothetical protein